MKKVIRLTEGDLHRIIKNSVKKIIKEEDIYPGYNSTTTDNYDEDSFNGLARKINSKILEIFGPKSPVKLSPNSNGNEILIDVDGYMSNDRQTVIGLWNLIPAMKDLGCAFEGNRQLPNKGIEFVFSFDEWPEERIEDRIDTEANMDDFPPMH